MPWERQNNIPMIKAGSFGYGLDQSKSGFDNNYAGVGRASWRSLGPDHKKNIMKGGILDSFTLFALPGPKHKRKTVFKRAGITANRYNSGPHRCLAFYRLKKKIRL